MHKAADGAQPKTEWDVVRSAALACLDAVQRLKSYADDSQGSYYNEKVVAMHLAAIKEAEDIFSQSLTVFSNAGATVFDQLLLAQASAGEAARPDFRFSATAHEAALVLLGETMRWVNIGLGDALVSIGARRVYNGAIDDLHLCSPKQLRDALYHSEKSKPLQNLFDRIQTQPFIRLRVWIDREWALAAKHGDNGLTSAIGFSEPSGPTGNAQSKKTEPVPNDSARIQVVPPKFDAKSKDWILSADLSEKLGKPSTETLSGYRKRAKKYNDEYGAYGFDYVGCFRSNVTNQKNGKGPAAYYIPQMTEKFRYRVERA